MPRAPHRPHAPGVLVRRVPPVLLTLVLALALALPTALVVPTAPDAGGGLPGGVAAAAVRTTADPDRVISRRVAFRVVNTNRTQLPCAADGRRYLLRGRIIGQRRELLRRPEMFRVFLHVHDLATGRWFWNLRRHPRVDHARRLARLGHVSVVLDRLGYDGSGDLPDGSRTCLGAHADMLHQVVQRLRSGRYASPLPVRRAGHVITVGHAVGAAVAQLEAATFDDVPGVVQMSWTNQGATPRALRASFDQQQRCAQGGDRVDGRREYAHFGADRAELRALLFHSAPAAVQRTATRLRNPDPCGDARSLAALASTNHALAGKVHAKLLLLYGAADARTRADARDGHRGSFVNAGEIDEHVVRGAGSALPLEAGRRTATLLSSWACRELSCPAQYPAG